MMQAEAMAAGSPSAIDRGHLAHMTFGDRSLEQEVLRLFERQAALLIARMRGADASAVASLAHTLKGSATGIGAWDVARAAEAVELASGAGVVDCDDAIARLSAAVDAAHAAIVELLHAA